MWIEAHAPLTYMYITTHRSPVINIHDWSVSSSLLSLSCNSTLSTLLKREPWLLVLYLLFMQAHMFSAVSITSCRRWSSSLLSSQISYREERAIAVYLFCIASKIYLSHTVFLYLPCLYYGLLAHVETTLNWPHNPCVLHFSSVRSSMRTGRCRKYTNDTLSLLYA